MSDDVWRRGRRDDEDDFGPPLFDDMTSELDPSDELSFGTSDTGPLPHWTAAATGEVPNMVTQAHEIVPDQTGELDVWSTFADDPPVPVWSDDPDPTGDVEVPASLDVDDSRFGAVALDAPGDDESAEIPRRGPGRITIGTDPTDDRMGRPMPKSRSRSNRSEPVRGTQRGRPSGPPSSRATPPVSAPRDMPTAVAVGLIIAAAFISALLFRPWAALAIVVAVVALASVEFFDKVAEKGYRPATVVGIVACTTLPLATYWVGERALPLVFVVAVAAGCLSFITSPGLESSPMPNMAITTLGIAWIGLMGSFGALILSASNVTLFNAVGLTTDVGTDTMFLLALGVVVNDIGALVIGSAAGRTPLRQWISPNKTVEGFIGGTLFTVITMVVVGVSDSSDTWNSTGDLIILGVVIAITAPLGDLTESMFKRNLEIKDFGSIVKGHGGVLDRFDGFLFTLPAVYYLLLVLEPWATL